MKGIGTKLIALVLALVLGLALAAGTPAGTAIQNQASASYIDSAGQPRTTTSNLVTTIVQQVYSFTITPDGTEANPGQIRNGLSGGQVLFQYTITNTGNGTDTINLSTVQGTSDNFDLTNILIYRDTNCNGNVDAGEPQVTSVTLAADASACVIVAATVPSTAQNGHYGNLNLAGTSQGNNTVTDNNNNNNWARAVATTQAALTAFKAANPSGNIQPDNTITYTISGSNTGGSAAYGIQVTVDGTPKTGILIEDTIPSGLTVTQMPTGSAGAGTVRFVYYDGTAWKTLQSGDLPLTGNGTIKIGMLIEGTGALAFFPQGARYTFSFQAQVPSNAPAGTSYTNTATVKFDANNDNDANDSGETVSTNSTTNTVAASYSVAVGPYGYPEGGATGSYQAGQYTVTHSGDSQSISSAYDGTQVIFRHTLKNTGNTSDSFSLSLSGTPTGWTCSFLAEDLATPISGPVGPVAAGGTYNFALRCSIPAGSTGGPFNLTVTATSQSDPTKSDTTSDSVNTLADGFRLDLFGGPQGGPDTQSKTTDGTNYTSDDSGTHPNLYLDPNTPLFPYANPGAQVVYRLRVQNLNPNGLADNYNLYANPTDVTQFNNRVASVIFYPDANNDGNPDGPAITNTGPVNANQTFNYLAVVTLKPDAPPGPAPFNFEARSFTNNELDWAYTEVWVNTVARVLLDPDRNGTVTSPGTIQYTHTLLNNSNAPATCSISGTGGSYGWTYQYSTDGTTWANQLSVSNVPANGGTKTIYVRVIVPAGEPVGRTDVNTVTANCNVGGQSASASATETTTIVGGELRLTKEVDKTAAKPGEVLTYTITAENIGTGNLTRVIVSDPIPAYTTFVSVSASLQGAQVLYSTDGTNWSPTSPTSVPAGGTVYVGVDADGDGDVDDQDAMPPAAKLTITLKVKVQ